MEMRLSAPDQGKIYGSSSMYYIEGPCFWVLDTYYEPSNCTRLKGSRFWGFPCHEYPISGTISSPPALNQILISLTSAVNDKATNQIHHANTQPRPFLSTSLHPKYAPFFFLHRSYPWASRYAIDRARHPTDRRTDSRAGATSEKHRGTRIGGQMGKRATEMKKTDAGIRQVWAVGGRGQRMKKMTRGGFAKSKKYQGTSTL